MTARLEFSVMRELDCDKEEHFVGLVFMPYEGYWPLRGNCFPEDTGRLLFNFCPACGKELGDA